MKLPVGLTVRVVVIAWPLIARAAWASGGKFQPVRVKMLPGWPVE